MHDRKNKGLCFNWVEKFEIGHKCERLFMIDGYGSEEIKQTQQSDDSSDSDEPELSLRAVKGEIGADTVRVVGKLEKEKLLCWWTQGALITKTCFESKLQVGRIEHHNDSVHRYN